jgi:hypothetical protein
MCYASKEARLSHFCRLHTPNHTYYTTALARGYECRAVYYIQWLSFWCFIVSMLALAVLACLSWLGHLDLSSFYSFRNASLIVPRILFPVFLLGLWLYLGMTNKPEHDNPTGVWRKWKEINDILKAWWDENQKF